MSIRPRELHMKAKGRRSAPGRSRTRARRPGRSRRRAPSSTRGRRRRRAAAPCLRVARSRTPLGGRARPCVCRSPVIQMPRIVHHISRFPRMNGWGPRQTRHLCFVILRTPRVLIPARGATVVKTSELRGTCEVRWVDKRPRRSIERASTTRSSLGISMERKVYVQRTGALKLSLIHI